MRQYDLLVELDTSENQDLTQPADITDWDVQSIGIKTSAIETVE